MRTKIPQTGCAMGSIFIESPFLGDSMKTSQPIRDGFGANINRFPKETICKILSSHRIAHFWVILAQKG
jgi:hypothetical protein